MVVGYPQRKTVGDLAFCGCEDRDKRVCTGIMTVCCFLCWHAIHVCGEHFGTRNAFDIYVWGSVISCLACGCWGVSLCTVAWLFFACVRMSITPCSPERPIAPDLSPRTHLAPNPNTYHFPASGCHTNITKRRPFWHIVCCGLCRCTPHAMASLSL